MIIAIHIMPLGDLLGGVWSAGAFCLLSFYLFVPHLNFLWPQTSALRPQICALGPQICPPKPETLYGISLVFSDLNSSLPSSKSALSSLKLALNPSLLSLKSALSPSLLSVKSALSHFEVDSKSQALLGKFKGLIEAWRAR